MNTTVKVPYGAFVKENRCVMFKYVTLIKRCHVFVVRVLQLVRT